MTEFKLPDIGEGIVECEVIEWKVAEGDTIVEDQPVVEVMTDKALVEITAPTDGRVTQLHVAKGEMARVHATLFSYDALGGEGESTTPDTGQEPAEDSAARWETPLEHGSSQVTKTSAGAVDFILPDIGEGIVECEVVEWHVAVGDRISEDQHLVDVMTDKAMVEITAPEDGEVSALHVAKGEMARVHAPLFAYRAKGGHSAVETAEKQEKAASSVAVNHVAASGSHVPDSGMSGGAEGSDVNVTAGKGAYGRTPASPAVRRLVREHGLKLEAIPGSGRMGRVLKEDVLAYLAQAESTETRHPAEEAPGQAATQLPAVGAENNISHTEPMRGIRAAMARQMVASVSTIPHFHYGEEIDVTELLALRQRLKPQAELRQLRLTLMPFFMKAMALAIRAEPILNARLSEDASEIQYLAHCNIGMAVDGKAGLMVPNIKGVEGLSVLDIAAEVQRLTEAAREGRVSQEDLKGGTISISNIGAMGGTYAAPIINAPEAAIVAIGKSQWLPRFNEHGEVARRAIMTVTWAGDHRLIDGGTIARFCNVWKGFLESPETMILHLS